MKNNFILLAIAAMVMVLIIVFNAASERTSAAVGYNCSASNQLSFRAPNSIYHRSSGTACKFTANAITQPVNQVSEQCYSGNGNCEYQRQLVDPLMLANIQGNCINHLNKSYLIIDNQNIIYECFGLGGA